MKKTLKVGLVGLVVGAAVAAGTVTASASTTPPGEENPYKLTLPPNNIDGCENSGGRSAGQYAEDCYGPYGLR